MSADLIVTAAAVITMDPEQPRARAVAIDTGTGLIMAVGGVEEVRRAAPGASLIDLGDTVLMPGFIDPHSHPMMGGLVTQQPALWMAPYVGYPTYADVEALWRKLDAELPPGQAVLCNGLDRLLQGAPELTNVDLDAFFPTRRAVILDNSGHEAYFNSAVIADNGWVDGRPPADPVGSHFGRNADGTSNGRAYETAAILAAVNAVFTAAVQHPLMSAARWYRFMAESGITMTSEHTFQSDLLQSYVALASVPDSPLRVALYHMSIDPTCGEKVTTPAPTARLWKQGIKLWADGSPWVGTIAASFPYLDTPVVQGAEIPLGPGGEAMMNYTRAQLDELLSAHGGQGWQFAFHVNGDVGLDVVLDAYEHALTTQGLLGTDHRWRVEHCGACRGDQFARAASLGVSISLAPFQFIYWGDLLDGQMFEPEIGSQWIRGADAFASGAVVTFHNDGPVSPPLPLLNVQSMVTRRTPSGTVHGPQQAVSLDDAFKAITVYAAHQLGRDEDLGSIAVGKLADFVELSADPWDVDVEHLATSVTVRGTWHDGRKVDLDAFLTQVQAIDPSQHQNVGVAAAGRGCC